MMITYFIITTSKPINLTTKLNNTASYLIS